MTGPRTQPHKRVPWTTRMRQVLCCLFRFFSTEGIYNKNAFERIFSQIFRGHLFHHGFKHEDLPFRTLHTQWHWMRNTSHVIWRHVHMDTEFCLDEDWKTVICMVKSAADRLGISLTQKDEDTVNTALFKAVELDRQQACEYLESVLTSDMSSEKTSATASPETDPMDESPNEDSIQANFETTEPQASQSSHSPDYHSPDYHLPDHHSLADYPSQADSQPQSPVHNPQTHHAPQCLVTGNGKMCFFCHLEGKPLVDTEPETEHAPRENLGHLGDPEATNNQIHEDPMDMAQDTPSRNFPEISPNLPGLCSPTDIQPRPLLYRWSNAKSQGTNTRDLFEAGLFKNAKSDFYLPNEIPLSAFLDHFKLHVTKARVETPLISTFANPLSPIHRAIHSRKEASVSIIDPFKLETPVFKAHTLMLLTGTATPCWRGYGEYEIWGRVPKEAIVCTFQISELAETTRSSKIQEFLQLELIKLHKRCNENLYEVLANNLRKNEDYSSTLRDLTKLLKVPPAYRDLVIAGFQQAWTKGFDRSKSSQDRVTGKPMPGCHVYQDEDDEDDEDDAAAPHLGAEVVGAEVESDSSSFRPDPTRSSLSASSSGGYSRSSSGSAEERMPRRDTSSPPFSVHSDSIIGDEDPERPIPSIEDREVAKTTPRMAAWPITPRSTEFRHRPQGRGSRARPLTFNIFNTHRHSDRELPRAQDTPLLDEWPSIDEAPDETPTKSAYFPYRRSKM